MLVTVPEFAVNVAAVALAATVTDDGIVNKVLLSDRVTVLPPVGAAWFNVTVQVVHAFEPSELGLHDTVDTSTCGATLTDAVFEALFKLAVMVTDWMLVTVPAVAVNVAEVLLAATVTEAGTVSEPLLLDRVAVLPPVGAA